MLERSVKNQYLATVCANIIALSFGTSVGWLSPFLPVLQSDQSPLATGAITVVEASWIGSLLCIGALIGSFIFGWMADRFGRKISCCAIAIPQLAFFLLVIFGKYVEYLYVARFLTGIAGGGVFLLLPMYVSEISETRIRGSLGSVFLFALNIGTLLSFVAGAFLSYTLVASILAFCPIAFLVAFSYFPETPQFLVNTNQMQEADLSLRFYRGITGISANDVEELQLELEKMARSAIASDQKSNTNVLKLFITSKAVRKSIIYGIILIALNMFCGCFALINYTASIFTEAGSTLEPNMSAIIVAIIQVMGSYVSTVIVDSAGRKVVYSATAFGSGLGFAVMGTHVYLKHIGIDVSSYNWVPIFCLSFIIFIASSGSLPLTYVIVSELMPQKIRSYGTSLCTAMMWGFGFIIIQYFATFVDKLGMFGCMWIFSGVCFSGVLFILLVIPETKGKSLDSITLLLEK